MIVKIVNCPSSQEFLEIDWPKEFNKLNFNDAYDSFLRHYSNICIRFIPKVFFTNDKRSVPWLTKDAKKKLRKKYSAWQAYKMSGWINILFFVKLKRQLLLLLT